jgi:nicotinate-nucleotide adenylyltransferase
MSYYSSGKNVILYGGAFDPIHKAHVATASVAIDMSEDPKADELWFLPCYSDAFGKKHLTSEEHRCTMIMLTIVEKHLGNMKLNTIEFDMRNKAGTYAVVKRLMSDYPTYNFTYLIGLDQALQIRSWRNSRKLLDLIRFIVVRRVVNNQPALRPPKWVRREPHIYVNNSPMFLPISSSEIRGQFLVSREEIRQNVYTKVAKSVKRYILQNDLYD